MSHMLECFVCIVYEQGAVDHVAHKTYHTSKSCEGKELKSSIQSKDHRSLYVSVTLDPHVYMR